MTMATDTGRLAEMDRLYDQYGQPFEDTHWGQFIVITMNGETVTCTTAAEAMERRIAAFGRGNYLFKIGERFVYRQRNAVKIPIPIEN
jgi:hypothetical protein